MKQLFLPSSRQRVPSTALAAARIVLCFAVIALLTWTARKIEIDDAFIYDRYISNALQGQGLVFNWGEHFNALSSSLYSYLLLFFSWCLHGQIRWAGILLFAFSLAGACALAELLVPCAGLLLASMGCMYSVIGMETPLFLLMLMLVFYAFVREKYDWLPVLLGLLVLTRGESALLVPLVAWQCYRAGRWPSLVSVLPAAALFGGIVFANHHYYGSYLPASSSAKLGQGRSQYWGRWPTAFFHVRGLTLLLRPARSTAIFLLLCAPFGCGGSGTAASADLCCPRSSCCSAFTFF